MFTGQPVFAGEDVSLTLSSVLQREPDWIALPVTVPPTFALFLRRCLVKDPKHRVRDIGDVRLAMAGTFESAGSATPADAAQVAFWQRPVPLAVTALALVAATALAVWNLATPAPGEPPTVRRFTIEMPPEGPVLTTSGVRVVAISPDGSQIAYESAAGGIYVRPVDELEATVLRGAEDGGSLFFSPDGQSIGFLGESNYQTLKRVSALGGPPVTIASFDAPPYGMEWASDDTILFGLGGSTGLLRIPAVGGEVEELTTADEEAGEVSHDFPTLLPDGETILFTILYETEARRLAILSLVSRVVTPLPITGSDSLYSPTGHIVYVMPDGTARAVGFDLDRLELTSTNPVPVLEQVNAGAFGTARNFDLAADGTLVYLSGATPNTADRSLVWVDPQGGKERLSIPSAAYEWTRLSPDGARAALVINDGENTDLWVSEVDRGTRTRLTTHTAVDAYPLWTQDGARVVFWSNRDEAPGLYSRAADASGTDELLAGFEGRVIPFDWSPDGSMLVFGQRPEFFGSGDIGLLTMEGEAATRLLLDTAANEQSPSISPDGAWLAYVSDETGVPEVYVQRFPELGDRRQVSTGGGRDPTWVLFTLARSGASWDQAHIVVQSLESGEREVLLEGGRDARYLPTGHLVYALNGVLLAAPFDVSERRVTGGPVALVDDVAAANAIGAVQFSIAGNGSLVYLLDSTAQLSLRAVWVERNGGQIEPIVHEPSVARGAPSPRLSPDGQRLALIAGDGDLWVYPLDGQPPTPLQSRGVSFQPVWNPEGTRLVFSRGQDLVWMPADGSTLEPERLLNRPNIQVQVSWLPDGRELVFDEMHPDTGFDLLAVSIEGDREARVLVRTEFNEVFPRLSPDGRWLAYMSDRAAYGEERYDIWVRRYDDPEAAPRRLSPNGGIEPVWSRDGRELFYLEGTAGGTNVRLMRVVIETEPELRWEPPEVVVDGGFFTVAARWGVYDVAPDGRFLMFQPTQDTQVQPGFIVVLNWTQELLERVPIN